MAVLQLRMQSLDGSGDQYSTACRRHGPPRCRISTDIDGEKITDVVQPRRAIHSTECSHSIQVHEHEGENSVFSVQRSTMSVRLAVAEWGRSPKIRSFWENGNQVAPLRSLRIVKQLNPPREQSTFKAQINQSLWGDVPEVAAEHGDQTWNKGEGEVWRLTSAGVLQLAPPTGAARGSQVSRRPKGTEKARPVAQMRCRGSHESGGRGGIG